MIALYGLKNCDSCRRALTWMREQTLPFNFYDVRETPPDSALLRAAMTAFGVEVLVNKRSTTWRQLDDSQRGLESQDAAIALLTEYPTLMKRPLLVVSGAPLAVGFKSSEAAWQSLTL
ncbi:MAG: Spx/MgsR family RNA polymerase-binding regulatory protein [Pseudomonadota bacterium]